MGKSQKTWIENNMLSNRNRNENRASKNEKCLQNLWEYNKDQIITSWESQKGKRKNVSLESIRRNNDWKYSDFGKTTSKAALWENYKELYSYRIVNLDQIPQKKLLQYLL